MGRAKRIQRRRRSRQKVTGAGHRQRRFEVLEDRLLLFADPFFSAEYSDRGVDLRLSLEDIGGRQVLTLTDTATNEAQSSAAVSEITGPVRIVGSNYQDALRIDLDPAAIIGQLPWGVVFEAGAGQDTLTGPTVDSTWNVTGANSGNLREPGIIGFTDVENLAGAAENQDIFVFGEGGSLSGLIDGGDGGFDTLVLDGGVFQSVVYTASGPDSGTIDRDGDVITYAGLEPIFDNGSAVDRVIRTSDAVDEATLTDNGATLTLAPVFPFFTFESLTFAKPTNNLTINLGDYNTGIVPGVPYVSAPVSLQDVLTVNSFNVPAIDLIVTGKRARTW